jgi:hypothetical protein
LPDLYLEERTTNHATGVSEMGRLAIVIQCVRPPARPWDYRDKTAGMITGDGD